MRNSNTVILPPNLANTNPPSETRKRERKQKSEEEAEQLTLDLETSVVFTGRLDSSKPSTPPPLTEVAPLQESGVVGLALASSAILFPSPALGTDFERRWRTVQSRWRTGLAGLRSGGSCDGGCTWLSRSSTYATNESSVMASLAHSSLFMFRPVRGFLVSYKERKGGRRCCWIWWWRRKRILLDLYGRMCERALVS